MAWKRPHHDSIRTEEKIMNVNVNENESVYISEFDEERLRALVEASPTSPRRDGERLMYLEEELDAAQVIPPAAMPPDVVTISSRVRVREPATGEAFVYTLVLPLEADFERGRISVLAPLGIAILGQRVGDMVEVRAPGGVRRLRIENVLYQPEAAGDFHR
jgi:regulator of nucleoside diphosphate kinase